MLILLQVPVQLINILNVFSTILTPRKKAKYKFDSHVISVCMIKVVAACIKFAYTRTDKRLQRPVRNQE